MNWILVGVVGYIAAQIAIGAYVSRRIASEDDYLLAGRRFGYGLATFSIFATWFGAETCVGAAGQVYSRGLSLETTEPYAYGLCLVLAGFLFAVPIWRAKLTTIADLFRTRFSPGVERFAALLLIPTSVCWAAAQIRAFGSVLTTSSALELDTATLIAALVVIVYTAFGGLLADAITDVVQGVAIIIGLIVVCVAVVGELGGLEGALASIDETRAGLASSADASWLDTLEAWSLPVIGSIVAQELIVRMSAARSPTVARRSTLIAAFAYVVVGSIPVFLGLLAPALIPALEDGDQVLPELARLHLSTLGHTLFAGALISAILSTVDSTLLVASSLFSHNLLLRALPGLGERAKVRLARAGVVGFGLIAYALAIASESVGSLIEHTNGFGSAGIFVVVVFGLFTKFGGRASAFAALVAGALVYFAGLFFELRYSYLASLAAAVLVYALGALAPRSPERARVLAANSAPSPAAER